MGVEPWSCPGAVVENKGRSDLSLLFQHLGLGGRQVLVDWEGDSGKRSDLDQMREQEAAQGIFLV